MRALLTFSQAPMASTAPATSRMRCIPSAPSRMAAYSPLLMGWSQSSASTQGGRYRSSSFTGNSSRTPRMIRVTSSSSSSRQLAARHVTSYRAASSSRSARARAELGSAELRSTRKGFPSSLSSVMTRSSASR